MSFYKSRYSAVNCIGHSQKLQSVNVFDPDGEGPAPLAFYFITLAGASEGTATINFDHEPGASAHGWFSSDFDVNWGLHVGSLDGPVLMTDTTELVLDPDDPGFWDHGKTECPEPSTVVLLAIGGQRSCADGVPCAAIAIERCRYPFGIRRLFQLGGC